MPIKTTLLTLEKSYDPMEAGLTVVGSYYAFKDGTFDVSVYLRNKEGIIDKTPRVAESEKERIERQEGVHAMLVVGLPHIMDRVAFDKQVQLKWRDPGIYNPGQHV
jgi:hypothetical protein